jgi:hypothetical protein
MIATAAKDRKRWRIFGKTSRAGELPEWRRFDSESAGKVNEGAA